MENCVAVSTQESPIRASLSVMAADLSVLSVTISELKDRLNDVMIPEPEIAPLPACDQVKEIQSPAVQELTILRESITEQNCKLRNIYDRLQL